MFTLNYFRSFFFIPIFCFLFLIFLPVSFATIDISGLQDTYLLGDTIHPVFSFLEPDFEGFLNIDLSCEGSIITYYRSPFSALETSEFTSLKVKLSDDLVGSCFFIVNLLEYSGNVYETKKSPTFDISSTLPFFVDFKQSEFLPGANLSLIFRAPTASSGHFLNVTLNGPSFLPSSFLVEKKEQTIVFSLPLDIAAGEHVLNVEALDRYGNTNELSLFFNVLQVASNLSLSFDKTSFYPSIPFSFSAILLDQSGEVIPSFLTAFIYDDSNVLYSTSFKSNSTVSYSFDSHMPSKEYVLEVKSTHFSVKKTIFLQIYESVSFFIENQSLYILNNGNINFDEFLYVELLSSDIVYTLNESVFIKPGDVAFFHLGTYVPTGVYDVVFPLPKETKKEVSKESSLLKNIQPYSYVGYDSLGQVRFNVSIFDQRNSLTKSAQSLSLLTNPSILSVHAFPYKLLLIFLSFIIFVFLIAFVLSARFRKNLSYVFHEKILAERKDKARVRTELHKTRQKKDRIEDAFKKHIDPHIVAEIVKRKSDSTQGKKQEISVLFSDIRGFSRLSEIEDPWFVAHLLNTFFERLSAIIKKQGGTINKYMGDSVMALFNAPAKDEDHIISALKAGLAIKKEVHSINAYLKKKGKAPISLGIGINSGDAIIGYFGSEQRLEYTAIGNVVNVASRIEGFSKNDVLITEALFQKVKSRVIAEIKGTYSLKNIEKPVLCYSVLRILE